MVVIPYYTYHLFEFSFYLKQKYGMHWYDSIFLQIIFIDQISKRLFTPRSFSRILIPVDKLLSKKVYEFTAHTKCERCPFPWALLTRIVTHIVWWLPNQQEERYVIVIYFVISIFFFFLNCFFMLLASFVVDSHKSCWTSSCK